MKRGKRCEYCGKDFARKHAWEVFCGEACRRAKRTEAQRPTAPPPPVTAAASSTPTTTPTASTSSTPPAPTPKPRRLTAKCGDCGRRFFREAPEQALCAACTAPPPEQPTPPPPPLDEAPMPDAPSTPSPDLLDLQRAMHPPAPLRPGVAELTVSVVRAYLLRGPALSPAELVRVVREVREELAQA